MAIIKENLQYYKLSFAGKVYIILNPQNWEELSYGIHNDLLTCNKNTEDKPKTDMEYLLSLLSCPN